MSEVRANYALGKFDRILFVGLLPGTDLVNGLKQICSDTGIRYGVILTVVGSLLKLTIGQVVPDEKKAKLGVGFMEHRVVSGPIQVVAVQGIIFEKESGETALHLHGAFNDKDGQVHGGHLVPGENPVRSRLEAVIGETRDVRLLERYDKKTGIYVFSPERP